MSRSNPGSEIVPIEEDTNVRRLLHDAAVGRWYRHVYLIKTELERFDSEPDLHYIAQLWDEISQADQVAMWLAPTKGGVFTTTERDLIKTKLPRCAES